MADDLPRCFHIQHLFLKENSTKSLIHFQNLNGNKRPSFLTFTYLVQFYKSYE